MQIRELNGTEILNGHYDRIERIANHGDTLIDGETGRVLVRAMFRGEPSYIAIVRDHNETGRFIFPGESSNYALIQTTEQGLKNLRADRFNFHEGEHRIVNVEELQEIETERRFIP